MESEKIDSASCAEHREDLVSYVIGGVEELWDCIIAMFVIRMDSGILSVHVSNRALS